jgi:FlaG/FlaF family flagellin (archaellin)
VRLLPTGVAGKHAVQYHGSQGGAPFHCIGQILATVILIAITLIAAIAVAGFVFGLFGTFTSSATVQGSVTTCTGTTNAVCTVVLSNTGSATAAVTGCELSLGGANAVGAYATVSGSINAGKSGTFTCMVTGTGENTVGSTAIGSFTLSNGATVSFAGTWST